MKILNIVLKTDVHGSLEAIKGSVMKLVNDEVKINILHSGVGAVSESDLIFYEAVAAEIMPTELNNFISNLVKELHGINAEGLIIW